MWIYYNRMRYLVEDIPYFWKYTINGLFSFNKYKNDKRFSNKNQQTLKLWSNLSVGISCLSFIIPGIEIILLYDGFYTIRSWIKYEMIMYFIVAINSFIADYICFGQYHGYHKWCHLMDRWSATFCGTFQVWKIMFIIPFSILAKMMYVIIIICGLLILMRSRQSITAYEFRFWHSLWHYWAMTAMSVVLYHEFSLYFI